MRTSFALAFVLLAGCAHPYTLDPLGEKTETLNGVALSTAVTPKCVLQAGYEYSNPHEMLVKVRVTNKEKGAFEVDYSTFSLNGAPETLKVSPLEASDPDKYVKELKTSVETLDARTHMESFQGVEELGVLKGEQSDARIDAAKGAYKTKKKEAEAARQQADAIRKRLAVIEPAVLHKKTLKSGESVEGALLFKAAFGETGVVTLESTIPACAVKIPFMLKK
jgi:hypothetical protein